MTTEQIVKRIQELVPETAPIQPRVLNKCPDCFEPYTPQKSSWFEDCPDCGRNDAIEMSDEMPGKPITLTVVLRAAVATNPKISDGEIIRIVDKWTWEQDDFLLQTEEVQQFIGEILSK